MSWPRSPAAPQPRSPGNPGAQVTLREADEALPAGAESPAAYEADPPAGGHARAV